MDSLLNGVIYVNNIAATLSEMPAKADMIEANRAAYVDQLLALIPRPRRRSQTSLQTKERL